MFEKIHVSLISDKNNGHLYGNQCILMIISRTILLGMIFFRNILHVNVKLTLEQATKAQRRSRGIA
jgi:hypothetical protein